MSPTSLGVLLFERPGVPPPAVHLTAPRLQGVMNQRIFRAIMGIVKGIRVQGLKLPEACCSLPRCWSTCSGLCAIVHAHTSWACSEVSGLVLL